MEQEAIRRVAERRLARRLHVVGVDLLAHEPAVGLRAHMRPMRPTWRRRRGTDSVRGPSAPACRADRVEQRFVPDAGNGMALPGWRRAVFADVVGALRAAAERAGAAQADEQTTPRAATARPPPRALTFSTTVSSPPGQRTRTSGTEPSTEPEVDEGPRTRGWSRRAASRRSFLPSESVTVTSAPAGVPSSATSSFSNRAAVLEQNERLAERQDGDVEIPIVVVVGDCAAPRDELAHSMHCAGRFLEPARPPRHGGCGTPGSAPRHPAGSGTGMSFTSTRSRSVSLSRSAHEAPQPVERSRSIPASARTS